MDDGLSGKSWPEVKSYSDLAENMLLSFSKREHQIRQNEATA